MKTAYEIMHLNYVATDKEIKNRYIELLNDNNNMQDVIKAYNTLINPTSRMCLDMSLSIKDKQRISNNYHLYTSSSKLFKDLECNIGQEVIVSYKLFGNVYVMDGILSNIKDYQTITVGMEEIPFISNVVSLIKVIRKDNEQVLYFNQSVNNDKEFLNEKNLKRVKEQVWGYGRDYDDFKKDNLLKMYVAYSKKYIKEVFKEEYLSFIKINSMDEESIKCIEAMIIIMKHLSNNSYNVNIWDQFNLSHNSQLKVTTAIKRYYNGYREIKTNNIGTALSLVQSNN